MVRPIAGFGLSILAAAALAACSGPTPPPPVVASPSPAPPPMAAPMPPPPPPALSADQQFIDQAAAGGMAEVEMGRMASRQAASRAVRAFGARMVRDHGSGNARLMALARRANMTPSAPGPVDAGPLAGLSGPEFDRAYMENQVQAHQATIAAFEAEAAGGQNPALRQFARSSLPMLRSHLRQAEAIARRAGA